MIRVRTLGTLDITMDGARTPAALRWKKNVALLLYLARAPKCRCTRERLIGLFWADKNDAAARHSARQAIRTLRQCVGENHLRTAGDVVELLDGAVELDTDLFEQLVKQGDWAGTTPLIGGEFLEGFKIGRASEFEDWLTVERSHWHGLMLDALLRHAEERLEAGDELGAAAPLARAEKLAPLSQRALRANLRRLAGAGDRSGALKFFTQFSKQARRAGDHPEPETTAIVERLQNGRPWHLPKAAHASRQSVSWRRAPLLGRERELATALQQWRNVGAGRVSVLVVEAEPGAGKSRFLEEIASRIALEPSVVLAVRAVETDLERPGSAILGLARAGLAEVPGVAGAHRAALATLAVHASEWAERFPQKDQPPSTWTIDAAVAEVLRVASAERPLLILFDDAQWIDATSYDMIERLVRDLARAPIMIVLASTPEPSPPKLAELKARLGRDIAGAQIALGRWGDDALRQLVQWALPSYTGAAAERLTRRIAVDSAGLPLLAVEICHAIAQGLDLKSTKGTWPHPLHTLDSTFPGDLPDTIVAAIRVGFRCLTRPAQRALVAVALLGERVAAKRVGCATELKGEPLDAALDELEWRRWLVAERRGYTFVARIVREVVVRDMITNGERQRILAKGC